MKPIGPDHGGDCLYLHSTVHFGLWDRIKFLVEIALGCSLSFTVEIDTEHLVGENKPRELKLDTRYEWIQRFRGPGIAYEASNEDRRITELREIDERNKRRSLWRRWFER